MSEKDRDAILRLDEKAKLAVIYKPLLAEFVRGTQPDYRYLTREEIMELIPGEGDMAEQSNTVLDLPGEKGVIVDTKVFLDSPTGERKSLLLAVDVQGYRQSERELVGRMVMYLSKLISSRLPPGDRYSRLMPTSVIWFDLNPPAKNRGSIIDWGSSGFRKVLGRADAGLEDPGLARITYVGLDKGAGCSGNYLLDLANLLWDEGRSVADRVSELREKYNIDANPILEDSMESFNVLSEQFLQMGQDLKEAELMPRIEQITKERDEAFAAADRFQVERDEAFAAADRFQVERDEAFVARDELDHRLEVIRIVMEAVHSGMSEKEAIEAHVEPESRELIASIIGVSLRQAAIQIDANPILEDSMESFNVLSEQFLQMG